jgi:hypothetical protein
VNIVVTGLHCLVCFVQWAAFASCSFIILHFLWSRLFCFYSSLKSYFCSTALICPLIKYLLSAFFCFWLLAILTSILFRISFLLLFDAPFFPSNWPAPVS